jgi:hypothetical protein
MFDPDPDSDPEKRFEKHQTLKLMTLTEREQHVRTRTPINLPAMPPEFDHASQLTRGPLALHGLQPHL